MRILLTGGTGLVRRQGVQQGVGLPGVGDHERAGLGQDLSLVPQGLPATIGAPQDVHGRGPPGAQQGLSVVVVSGHGGLEQEPAGAGRRHPARLREPPAAAWHRQATALTGRRLIEPGGLLAEPGQPLAQGPGAAFDFGFYLVKTLAGAAREQEVRHGTYYR